MHFLPFSYILSLREELKGTGAKISTWGCDDYNDLIKEWNESSETQVGAVVQVTTDEEAATVVRFAAQHRVPLVVKGGGCSTSGASTIHGGIVLNLSGLRSVHVNPTSRVIIAEGGALWEDIDIASTQHSLAVVGSTLNQIGAAGATLGGGYGWLTGQYGLAIDNLLWAKMILANGNIAIASEDQNPDLFWAIRGAGQSFGVAVELAFLAHKQDHLVFAGTLLLSLDNLPTVVRFANQFETITKGKEGLWFGFTTPPYMDQCSIIVALFYNGSQSAAEIFFSPLISLDCIFNNLRMLPYDGVNGILSGMHKFSGHNIPGTFNISYPINSTSGARKSLDGANFTLPLDLDFVRAISHNFNHMLRDYPQARESTLLFEIIPNTKVMKVSNDSMAFASRGPYYNVSSLVTWREESLDQKIQSFQRGLMDDIAEKAGIARRPDYLRAEHGVGLYANYAGHEVPARAIFGDNTTRLRELKEKYDPENMFRHWHNINAGL
ncbi:hypothetical protein N7540_003610 [Penicillium herquei]|nr:hypothetical protein N7540_003610 [Penicillium herquei]